MPEPFAVLPPDRRTSVLAPAIVAALTALDARCASALARIPEAHRDTAPRGGGWSARQVLEHVTLANEQYLAVLAPLAAQVAAQPPSERAWRATAMGWLLARSLRQRLPQRAPAAIVPGPQPRADVERALAATHDALRALVTDAAGRDWRQGRLRSPLATWVRLSFGDACLIVLRHGERHAAQLERLAGRIP
jgi:hypothetical protein